MLVASHVFTSVIVLTTRTRMVTFYHMHQLTRSNVTRNFTLMSWSLIQIKFMIVIFENRLTICKFAIISIQSSIVGAPLPTRTAWPLISGDVDCHTLNCLGTSVTIGHIFNDFQLFCVNQLANNMLLRIRYYIDIIFKKTP